jgi:hypothetical protein
MLSDQVNEALNSLKEAKAIRQKGLPKSSYKFGPIKFSKSLFFIQKKEENALRLLICPKGFNKQSKSNIYGGLLISSFYKYLIKYSLSQTEKDDVINSTFQEIYKYVEKMQVDDDGKINKGLSACNKIFKNQAAQYVRNQITARGDGSPHKPTDEIRKKVKDWSIKGHTYQFIGFDLSIKYEDLIKHYKTELDNGKEDDFDKQAKRIKPYFLEPRMVTGEGNINNDIDDIDDWEPESFTSGETNKNGETIEVRTEPVEVTFKSKTGSIGSGSEIVNEKKISQSKLLQEREGVVDCMNRGFKLFATKEPDRAFVITLKFPETYDQNPSFLKKAWSKFKAPKEFISAAEQGKLSSAEIGEIMGKKAENVDVYFNESKEKFKEYVKHCMKFLTGKGETGNG